MILINIFINTLVIVLKEFFGICIYLKKMLNKFFEKKQKKNIFKKNKIVSFFNNIYTYAN